MKPKNIQAYIMEVLRDKELSRELQEGYFFGKICV
ncbi:MAG: hypothetical protein PG979_001477 [Rickettsia asembonensis]|nr:MAG: hypothetical protein PG979_001477 [Rickettsia asembonensis]